MQTGIQELFNNKPKYRDEGQLNSIMTTTQDENPFGGMKINDWKILEKLEGRAICSKCSKSRKYFCYTCYVPVPELQEHVPKVQVSVQVQVPLSLSYACLTYIKNNLKKSWLSKLPASSLGLLRHDTIIMFISISLLLIFF